MSAVAFLLKREQPEAVDLCQRLVQALRASGERELVLSDHIHPPAGVATVTEAELPDDIKLLVVLGGDGTLLYGAGLLRETSTPILGVNLGHLGFLSACSPGQAVEVLGAALSGGLVIEERQRLCCRVYRGPGPGGTATGPYQPVVAREAVNEIVLSQPQQARLFELDAYVDGEHVTTYKADGLIVATPTGSTAYNMAAGGPILTPQMKALVLTPICPHTLTARPLVAPLSSSIEIRQGRNADRVMLTCDGQFSVYLGAHDRVEVSCASTPLRLFKAPDHTFFDLLRVKLHWGVRE